MPANVRSFYQVECRDELHEAVRPRVRNEAIGLTDVVRAAAERGRVWQVAHVE